MEITNLLEGMRSQHSAILALIRYTGISPKELVKLSHEDLANEKLDLKIIDVEEQWVKDHTGKQLVFTKHPFKRLFSKLWRTLFPPKPPTTSNEKQ